MEIDGTHLSKLKLGEEKKNDLKLYTNNSLVEGVEWENEWNVQGGERNMIK